MNLTKIRCVVFLASFVVCGRLLPQQPCGALKDSDKTRLASYVLKKYRVPVGTALAISENSIAGSTCYRKLEFKSLDPQRFFQIDLYASPDLRFLSRDLLDTTVDPLEEQRLKAAALAVGLTRGDFPAIGPEKATVTLAVFSDFQCPYCAQMANVLREVVPQESGNVRLVFRHFPLPMHPWARPAAEATACAQDQGMDFFWRLHDFIFDHQRELTPDNLRTRIDEYAKGLKDFAASKFSECMIEKRTAARIEDDVRFARQNGINATPTLFINGQQTRISGPDHLRTIIRELLKPAAAPAVASR